MELPKFKKPTKRQVRKAVLYCLTIVVGNAIAAGASAFFIIPNGLVMGGTTGLGIFVRNVLEHNNVGQKWTDWTVNITVYALNIIFFITGAFLLGKKFAGATLAGTLLYPSFMSIYTPLNQLYMEAHGGPVAGDNILLAVIFGAMLFGLGIAIVVRVGASTGGTDIPPLIFNKYFGTPISLTLWILDMSIILLQLIVMPLETVLYGVLIAIISSVVVDVASPIGMKRTQVKIISKKYREIRHMILDELNRGVTVLYGETGYLKERCRVLLTIVSNRELVRLKNKVQSIDPEAFMMISVISEVRGRGFTSEGIKLPKEQEAADDAEENPSPSAANAESADSSAVKGNGEQIDSSSLRSSE